MRRMRNSGNFFLCLLLNMLMNLEWTIPAWILLVLYFVLDWSILWFWLALGLWVLDILIMMGIMRWASTAEGPDRPRENKNPYSVGAHKKDGTHNE